MNKEGCGTSKALLLLYTQEFCRSFKNSKLEVACNALELGLTGEYKQSSEGSFTVLTDDASSSGFEVVGCCWLCSRESSLLDIS